MATPAERAIAPPEEFNAYLDALVSQLRDEQYQLDTKITELEATIGSLRMAKLDIDKRVEAVEMTRGIAQSGVESTVDQVVAQSEVIAPPAVEVVDTGLSEPPPPPPADPEPETEPETQEPSAEPETGRAEGRKKGAATRQQQLAELRESHAKVVLEITKELGIFTGKRLEAAMQDRVGSKNPASRWVSLTPEVEEVIERHGGMRGPGVFFTHKDYDGPKDFTTARGGEKFVHPGNRKKEASAGDDESSADLQASSAAAASQQSQDESDGAHPLDPDDLLSWAIEQGPDAKFTQKAIAGHFDITFGAAAVVANELVKDGSFRLLGSAGTGGKQYCVSKRPLAEPTEAKVRDAVLATYRDGELFSPQDIIGDRGWDKHIVIQRLRTMAEKSVLNDDSVGEMILFSYKKPDAPGAAAKLDQQRRPAESPSDRTGGGPVAGTGRPAKMSPNKEIQAIVNEATARQGVAEKLGNDHIKITNTVTNKHTTIASTPRSPASIRAYRRKVAAIIPGVRA
jgi:hypothetical protein